MVIGMDRRSARKVRFGFIVLAAVLAGGWEAPAAAGDALPVKLEIVASAHAVTVGDAVTVNIVLRGADNAVAAAPKQFNVQFEVKTPVGPLALPNVVIAAGQSGAQVQFQVTAPGVWAVRARNSELLEGGTVIYAKPSLHSETQGGTAPQQPPAASTGTEVALNEQQAAPQPSCWRPVRIGACWPTAKMRRRFTLSCATARPIKTSGSSWWPASARSRPIRSSSRRASFPH